MSKKGPENVTQTTLTQPPDYLLPFLRQAAGSAQALFQRGPQQFYPDNSVTPFSPQTNMALNLQQDRALNGSPVVGAANSFTRNLLNGESPLNSFMPGAENPYLDKTFDRAAGAVGRSLDTTMARAGRDLDANMGVRADALNNLATDIYGGAYESDRNRQLNAASTLGSQQLSAASGAIPLAREDYFDIAQLGGVGQAVEGQSGNIIGDRMNRFNFQQEAPYASLDRFISQLSGVPAGQNSSSTQPYFSNTAGNLLGGALTGASLFGTGGALAGIGGITGAGGAGIGGLLGLLSDRRAKENIRRVGSTDSGIPVYVYNYIGSPVIHMGVMADEVEHIPDAVHVVGGFKRVNYGLIN